MKILDWTKPSVADLSAIRGGLIREASVPIAIRVLEQIRRQADQLEAFPALGTALTPTRRKLRVRGTNYVIIYRIKSTAIEILRVHHVRQDWQQPE